MATAAFLGHVHAVGVCRQTRTFVQSLQNTVVLVAGRSALQRQMNRHLRELRSLLQMTCAVLMRETETICAGHVTVAPRALNGAREAKTSAHSAAENGVQERLDPLLLPSLRRLLQ